VAAHGGDWLCTMARLLVGFQARATRRFLAHTWAHIWAPD
jgi:hypothetical protein